MSFNLLLAEAFCFCTNQAPYICGCMVSPAPEEASDSQASGNGDRPRSCVPCFDALWFCYSPVHQFKQYYRVGNVDDCLAYWNDLWDCLKQRTKYRDPVASHAIPKHPLYTLRTPEQAQKFWAAEFGHLQVERDAEAADRNQESHV